MFINLTPHAIVVHRENDEPVTLEPSGSVARVEVEYGEIYYIPATEINGIKLDSPSQIPISTSSLKSVEDLPDQREGVYYVVSSIVRTAVPDRLDVLSPGSLIRDALGKPIGCDGLVGNANVGFDF